MKLYVSPLSPNARRAMLVNHLVGSIAEVVPVDLRSGQHKEPWFLALNPNHKVPTLEDGSVRLWESNAIAQYLAAKAGRADLWPTDPAAQADVSRWQFWTHTHLNGPVNAIVFERLLKNLFGMGEPDLAVVTAKLSEFATEAQVLDKALAGRSWLCGDALTLADVSVGASFTYAHAVQLPLDGYANLKGWVGRLRELPAWAATEPPR